MIPKIVHYVWVGYSEKPDLFHRCMASWKRFLPGYEFQEWGNDSLKQIDVPYVHEAFQMKKWAFVSDYLRLYALYNHGGFYFDTDLEVTANLDRFTDHSYVTGFEDFNGNAGEGYPVTALMGSEKENLLIKKMLDEYNGEPFILANGGINTLTNTKRITRLIRQEYQLPEILDPDKLLLLDKESIVYPSHYFSTPKPEMENYSIHHFDGSWHDNFSRFTFLKLGPYKLTLFRQKDMARPFNYIHYGNEIELGGCSPSSSSRVSLLKNK